MSISKNLALSDASLVVRKYIRVIIRRLFRRILSIDFHLDRGLFRRQGDLSLALFMVFLIKSEFALLHIRKALRLVNMLVPEISINDLIA